MTFLVLRRVFPTSETMPPHDNAAAKQVIWKPATGNIPVDKPMHSKKVFPRRERLLQAGHYVFQTNEADVMPEMNTFLAGRK